MFIRGEIIILDNIKWVIIETWETNTSYCCKLWNKQGQVMACGKLKNNNPYKGE